MTDQERAVRDYISIDPDDDESEHILHRALRLERMVEKVLDLPIGPEMPTIVREAVVAALASCLPGRET